MILFEDVPGFRQVFLDGRGHPSNWDPTWMGHSTGKWDGDVLVVDTVGFNDRSWLGGIGGGNIPHTEMLHMTERYRRVDFGHMDLALTFDDPGTFVKPFHMTREARPGSAGGADGVRLREQQAGASGGQVDRRRQHEQMDEGANHSAGRDGDS